MVGTATLTMFPSSRSMKAAVKRIVSPSQRRRSAAAAWPGLSHWSAVAGEGPESLVPDALSVGTAEGIDSVLADALAERWVRHPEPLLGGEAQDPDLADVLVALH